MGDNEITLRDHLESKIEDRISLVRAAVDVCGTKLEALGTAFEDFRHSHKVVHDNEERERSIARQERMEWQRTHNELQRQLLEVQGSSVTLRAHDLLVKEINGCFTRQEHEQYSKRVDEDIRGFQKFQSMLEGKASQSQMNITFILSFVGVLLGAVAVLLQILHGAK